MQQAVLLADIKQIVEKLNSNLMHSMIRAKMYMSKINKVSLKKNHKVAAAKAGPYQKVSNQSSVCWQ